MTSRVQKGSAIFRPLAKQRSRPTPAPPSQNIVNSESLGLTFSSYTAHSSSPAPSQLQIIADQHQPTQIQVPLQQTQPVIPISTPLSFSPSAVHPRSTPATLPFPAPSQIQGSARSRSQTQAPVSINVVTSGSTQTRTRGMPINTPRSQAIDNDSINESSDARSHAAAEQAGEENYTARVVIDDENSENMRAKGKRKSAATIEGEEDGNEQGADGNEAVKSNTSKKTKKAEATASSMRTKPKTKGHKFTADSSPTERSSAKPSARKKTRRSQSKSPFDPSADPGAELDPTLTTMAALCEDTGQGRVSSKAAEILSNHEAWKKERKERRARLKATMERKKYGLAEDEEDERGAGKKQAEADSGNSTSLPTVVSSEEPANLNDNPDNFDYSQSLQRSRFNVQVRIGPNGETIIDEESLIVDRVEGEQGEGEYEKVIESDMSKFVNSGTYGKRFRGSRWSKEETELFYDALAQYGENYELISYVLPGRDRKACKNKFKAEDKRDPGRINQCLNNRIPVDIKTLARMTGKDFSGPTPQIALPPPPNPPEQPPGASVAQQTNLISSLDRGRKEKPGNSSSTKRSRSRTAVLEDGVEVLGDVDAYAMDD